MDKQFKTVNNMEKKNQVKVYGKTTVFYLWDKDVEMFFKGVAVCNENDTFDAEVGEKLARAKAVYKMRLFKANALSDLLADIEEAKALEAEAKTEYEYWRDKAQESAELVNKLQKEF